MPQNGTDQPATYQQTTNAQPISWQLLSKIKTAEYERRCAEVQKFLSENVGRFRAR
jgi:hypothetical protein